MMSNSFDTPTRATNSDQTTETRHKGPVSPLRLAYTVTECASILSIGKTNLYALIKDGRLRAKKCGRRTLILATDIEAFLDALEPSN